MARLFFINWLLTNSSNLPKMCYFFCQSRLRILPNTKYPSKVCPSGEILPNLVTLADSMLMSSITLDKRQFKAESQPVKPVWNRIVSLSQLIKKFLFIFTHLFVILLAMRHQYKLCAQYRVRYFSFTALSSSLSICFKRKTNNWFQTADFIVWKRPVYQLRRGHKA